MKTTFSLLIKLIIFWMVFFISQRLLFIIHYWSDLNDSLNQVLKLLFYGFKLDISLIAYFISIPFIILIFNTLLFKAIKWITLFLGFLSTIIYSIELVSYSEWRSKLTSKLFIHLNTPSEIFRTTSGEFMWWFLFYVIIQLVILYFLYRLLIKKVKITEKTKTPTAKVITTFILGSFCLIIMARGGFQPIPIGVTNAYYSNSQIFNDLSVNSTWSFIDMTLNYNKSNSETFFNTLPKTESKVLVTELYDSTKIDSIRLFNTNTPDIIYITLEGWSAQMMGCLDGISGVTPHFDSLSNEGVLFTNIYATSSTSETGHSSIFSGYPTIPRISISHQLAKCRAIPSLVRSLNTYSSAYYFGGDLEYGNIGGYLKEIGFENVYDEDNLPELSPKGYLGYHDGAMLPYFLEDLKKAKSPYVYGLFTQSTHSPYDMPEPMLEAYPDSKYASSLHYADKAIQNFTDELKKLPNFENTLVVFISDHGKTNLMNKNTYNDDFFHIPVLFWGGALKHINKGLKIKKIGSQIDIVKTLLNQLEINTSPYIWSKDLLNPNTKEWAMFSLMNMYGVVTKNGYSNYMIYSKTKLFYPTSNQKLLQSDLEKCTAFNESVYQEFIEL